MSLVQEQWNFLKHVGMLIAKVEEEGLVATGGDLYRSSEMLPCPHCKEPVSYQGLLISAGRSWTYTSRHLSRLAVDLNFFKLDPATNHLTLCNDRAIIAGIGTWWEGLDPLNVHGLSRGDDGKDIYHFERKAV